MSEVLQAYDTRLNSGDPQNITATDVGSKRGIDTNIVGGVVSGTFSPGGANTDIQCIETTITDAAWVDVGGLLLMADFNNITLQNKSSSSVLLLHTSNTAPATEGIEIDPRGFWSQDIKSSLTFYCRAPAGQTIVIAVWGVY